MESILLCVKSHKLMWNRTIIDFILKEESRVDLTTHRKLQTHTE